jgi:hypothetical protein
VLSLLAAIMMGEMTDAQCYRTYATWLQQKLFIQTGRRKAKSPLNRIERASANN